MTLRILLLCTDQGVRVPGTKGASLHLDAVARAYVRLGHDVLVMAVAGHGPVPRGYRTWLLPHPGRATGVVRERNKLALTEQFATDGLATARAFAPHVLHERLSLFGTAGVALAAATGARHALEVNALVSVEEATWRGLVGVDEATRRERDVLLAADHVVAVSEQWSERVRLVRPDGVSTVPNGFDEELFARAHDRAAVRRRLGLTEDDRVAVFAGTLRPWHGVDVAVDALAVLPRRVRLVVVGDGPVLDALADRARRLGVGDRLLLTGRLPHPEAVEVVRAADVGLAPYPQLPDFAFSPLKVFEYLAAGIPVVTSDLGQAAALVRRHGAGRAVTPGDPAALAEGICSVLDDTGVRARAAAASRHAFERYGWRARAREVLDAVLTSGATR